MIWLIFLHPSTNNSKHCNMALIDKETIRKEIQRRIKIYGDSHAGDATQYDSRKVRALVGLLEFLDTLPEQPVKGLEEVPKEIYILQSKLAPNSLGTCWHDHALSSNTCNNIKYIRADLDKQPMDELDDDEIIDYAHSKFYYDKDFDGYGHSKFRPVLTREDLISFARHFAEWGKNNLK